MSAYVLKDEKEGGTNPLKFMLWGGMAAMTMTFMGLTSAYILRRAEADWWQFQLPDSFLITTVLVILSSFTAQYAYNAAKKDEFEKLKLSLWVTFILGIAFCIGQYYGWKELVSRGIHLVDNASASFAYVLSGLHLLHVIGGLIYMAMTLSKAHRLKIHAKNTISIYLCTMYWHFVGALWVYLYLFLTIYR